MRENTATSSWSDYVDPREGTTPDTVRTPVTFDLADLFDNVR